MEALKRANILRSYESKIKDRLRGPKRLTEGIDVNGKWLELNQAIKESREKLLTPINRKKPRSG